MNGAIITFVGNLTRDPGEMRYSRNGGVAYLTLGVAVNTFERQDQPVLTDFYNVTLFGRHAENALNRCRKGHQVLVQGNYRIRHYNRNDGSQGISHDVSVREFHHFPRDPRPEQEGSQPEQAAIPAGQTGARSQEGSEPETRVGTQAENQGQQAEDSMDFGEPFTLETVEAGDPFGEEIPAV